MATKLRASRLLTYSAAKSHELNIDVTKEASMAKAFSSKTAVKIASEAVQIHGEQERWLQLLGLLIYSI